MYYDTLTEANKKIEQLTYPQLKVEVSLRRRKNPYPCSLKMSGFDTYHIECCKKYGLKMEWDSKSWVGNL
jgi:hypothetical protein